MDMDVVQIISTVGFPIFSFLAAGFALKYVYDKERSSLDSTIDKIGALTLAVEKNSEELLYNFVQIVKKMCPTGDSIFP